MEICALVLTKEDMEALEFLSDFYGENSRANLMKLALRKFVKEHFAADEVEEYGEDEDLEKIRGE
jgi:hypothetical protein